MTTKLLIEAETTLNGLLAVMVNYHGLSVVATRESLVGDSSKTLTGNPIKPVGDVEAQEIFRGDKWHLS